MVSQCVPVIVIHFLLVCFRLVLRLLLLIRACYGLHANVQKCAVPLKGDFCVCSVVYGIVPQVCCLALFCMGAAAIVVLKQHSR